MFAISEEGEFRSVVPIDREEHDKFDLIVRATDAGGELYRHFLHCSSKG